MGCLRYFLAALLFAAAAWGQAPSAYPEWGLVVSEYGEGVFQRPAPPCQPLAYYSQRASVLEFPRSYARGALLKAPFQTQVLEIGVVDGRAIYDVAHLFSPNIVVKMIVVEQSPGCFRKIYHAQNQVGEVSLARSFLVQHDGRDLLCTRSRVSGTGAFFLESYWVFRPSGPVQIELEGPLSEVKKRLLSPGTGVWKGYGFNVQRLCYAAPVWNDGDANCCPTAGRVLIRFQLKDEQLVPVSEEYDPDGDTRDVDARCPLDRTPYEFKQPQDGPSPGER